MAAADQPTDIQDARPASLTIPEEPYSIFDKRQKLLIVLIVSTAGTCK